MSNTFLHCFQSEWLKKRRSFASWLVVIGGFFTPFISIIVFLVYPEQLLAIHEKPNFWAFLFYSSWQSMAFMLLPMGIVLAVSLITQIEFRNNTWKQVHTAPVAFSNIYFAKLLVLIIMLIQLFVLYNIGIVLTAIIPALLSSKIPFPDYGADIQYILTEDAKYFLMCLPVLAFQYIISLQFKNFMIPLGVGLAMVIGGLIALSWQYAYILFPAYTALHYLQSGAPDPPAHDLTTWAVAYFVLLTAAGYWLYISKKEKG